MPYKAEVCEKYAQFILQKAFSILKPNVSALATKYVIIHYT